MGSSPGKRDAGAAVPVVLNDGFIAGSVRAHHETGGAEGTQTHDGADDPFRRHRHRVQANACSNRRMRSIRRRLKKAVSDAETSERAEYLSPTRPCACI